MKKSTRFFALCLALVMCLSLAMTGAMGETAQSVETQAAPAEATDDVVVTVNGQPVLASDVQEIYDSLYTEYTSQGYDLTGQESILQSMAMDYAVQETLFRQKAAEVGADQFTEDEEAGFLTEAQTQWDSALEQYYTYFLTAAGDTPTEEEIADAKAQVADYLTSMGYSLEQIATYLKDSETQDRLTDALLKDVAPYTQEDVQAEYEKRVQEDQAAYENDIAAYEDAYSSGDDDIWYVPEGIRGITHILMSVDDDLLNTYLDLKEQLDDQQTQAAALAEENLDPIPADEATLDPSLTETPEPSATPEVTADPSATATPAPATQADVDAARQAVLDSIKDKLDDIYSRLAAGEAFASLVEEYGEDPGMQQEPYKSEGYSVHKGFETYIPEFTEGAFAAELQNVGDYGQPVIGSYGVHILYYLRDVPSGPVALTEELSASLLQEMEDTRTSNVLPDAMEEWLAAAQIVYAQAETTEAPEAESTAAPDETVTEAPAETPAPTSSGN